MKEILREIEQKHPENYQRIYGLLVGLQSELEDIIESTPESDELLDKLNQVYDEMMDLVGDEVKDLRQLNFLEKNTGQVDRGGDHKDYLLDTTIPHSLLQSFTYTKPYGFKFINDNLIEAKTWKDLYVKACQIFIQLDEERFLSFENRTNMNGDKIDYFSIEKDNMDSPVKIHDKIYINIKFDANEFRDMLIKILKEYDFDAKDFVIYLRADYSV